MWLAVQATGTSRVVPICSKTRDGHLFTSLGGFNQPGVIYLNECMYVWVGVLQVAVAALQAMIM